MDSPQPIRPKSFMDSLISLNLFSNFSNKLGGNPKIRVQILSFFHMDSMDGGTQMLDSTMCYFGRPSIQKIS